MNDLNALNDFIGNKKFLLGDKACDADASIFGMMSQIICHDRGFLNKHVTGTIF